LVNWIDTLADAPGDPAGASAPTVTVIYGLPLNLPVLLVIVASDDRLVDTNP
jgi:hypothetical protein